METPLVRLKQKNHSRARRPPRRAAALLAFVLLMGAGPPVALLHAMAATPAADIEPLEFNYGVFDRLHETQAIKAAKTDPSLVEPFTEPVVSAYTVPTPGSRLPLQANYSVVPSTQGIPNASVLFDDLEGTPFLTYSSVFDFLISTGPLTYAIFTNCSGVSTWVNGSLRPTFDLQFTNGTLQFVDWERWVEVDCDANPSTGDTNGSDLRARLTPVILNITFGTEPGTGPLGFPIPTPTLSFLGGVAMQVERLGPQTPVRPVSVAVVKSFSYDENNYVWFIHLDLPDIPTAFFTTITSDVVQIQGGNVGDTVANLLQGLLGVLDNYTYVAQLRGPYRLGWDFLGALSHLTLSAGYARYFNGTGVPVLAERTWFDVGVAPGTNETSVPSQVRLRLDSESLNKSFDYLQWIASAPSRLQLHYYDDRENFTYAEATLDEMPIYLEATVDTFGSGDNSTTSVRYLASDPIAHLEYDEYIFLDSDPNRYIRTHVRLRDVPTSLIINGTLDVGATLTEPGIRPRPGISLVGELIDRVMVRIASKLYSVGQTLRSIPNNILNLPDEKGWVSIDLPSGGVIGSLEFWLTSGKHVNSSGNYVAFYNDSDPSTPTPPGAVSTSLSGRLDNIECLVAGFFQERAAGTSCITSTTAQGTMLTLVTRGNRPLTALFLDAPHNSTAVARISNLPHVFSFRIEPARVTYSASSRVSAIEYLSEIEGHYTRILLQDLPTFFQMNETAGNIRVETLVDPLTGRGGIALFEFQVSDREPYTLPGDHLLVYQEPGVNAVSVRLRELATLRYDQGPGGNVQLRAAGGQPFAMAFINRSEPLAALLYFDPLPSQLDVRLPGSLQSVDPIPLPRLGSLSSVLDFSHIIFGIDEFGKAIVNMLSQVGVNLANGIGRFDQNFSFAFDSDANTTLIASVTKGEWSRADDSTWVHGLRSRQRVSPANNSTLDLTTKLYLSGLPEHMDFSLNVEAEVLKVNTTLLDFTPAFDYLAIETDAASPDPLEQPKNIRFFTDGIRPHTDIRLSVTFRSDLTIGGLVVGDMNVNTTSPLQNFYVRLTTRTPRPTSVEVLIPEIPVAMSTRAVFGDGITISHHASDPVEFVFVRMSRGILSPDHSAFAIFHDVPPSVDLEVPPAPTFEVSETNPIRNFPNITISTSEPGLDLVADVDGKALGSRGGLRFFVNDLGTRLTMLGQGDAYSISSDGVKRLLFSLVDFPLSKGLTIDALSIYAEDVRSVTLSMETAFGAYPIIFIDNLNSGRTEIRFEHRIEALSGQAKATTFVFVAVPVGRGDVGVYSNGIVTAPDTGGRQIILPAPVLSVLLSQF